MSLLRLWVYGAVVFSTPNNSRLHHNSNTRNDQVADGSASFGFRPSRCHTLGSALSGTAQGSGPFSKPSGSAIYFPQRVRAHIYASISRTLGKSLIDVRQCPSQGISEIATRSLL